MTVEPVRPRNECLDSLGVPAVKGLPGVGIFSHWLVIGLGPGLLGSPYERNCYLRVPLESQTTGPQTNNEPLAEIFVGRYKGGRVMLEPLISSEALNKILQVVYTLVVEAAFGSPKNIHDISIFSWRDGGQHVNYSNYY